MLMTAVASVDPKKLTNCIAALRGLNFDESGGEDVEVSDADVASMLYNRLH